MNNFKGTKGNWTQKHGDVFSDLQDSNDAICDVYHFDTDEGKANASLIAKSREMLDLLDEFTSHTFDFMGCDEIQELQERAKQLIKEATEI